MESIIAQMLPLISPQAIPLVFVIVCCVFLYLKIGKERKQTKHERDAAYDDLIARVMLLENEMKQIKQLDLDARLASIETSLKYIESLLKDLKDKD